MDKAPLTLSDIQEVEEMLECGMQDEAETKIIMLATQLQRGSVFDQIGALTRDLHDSITNFTNDERLKVIILEVYIHGSEREG